MHGNMQNGWYNVMVGPELSTCATGSKLLVRNVYMRLKYFENMELK